MHDQYCILLFYCYTKIDDPDQFREDHHLLCLNLNLRGRVIIAKEGLNGTVSGVIKDCESYMYSVKKDPRFRKIDFKKETHNKIAFTKLHVRVKDEIVNSGLKHLNPNLNSGKYIKPKDFKKILKSNDRETIILDVRSNYEHKIGKFKNAITLDIDNFREFCNKINELDDHKNKKIITYCTGGVKCEKASGLLMEKGFKDVYQLHGGVINYGIKENGEDFEGKCYVFDNRIVSEVNTINPSVLSKCHVTGNPSDRMVNCANPECNLHMPLSEEGAKLYKGCCSKACMDSPNVRIYNGTGNYQKEINGYDPSKGSKRLIC